MSICIQGGVIIYLLFDGNHGLFLSKANQHSSSWILLSGECAGVGKGFAGDGGKLMGFTALHAQSHCGSL